jgi:hypothetical protein
VVVLLLLPQEDKPEEVQVEFSLNKPSKLVLSLNKLSKLVLNRLSLNKPSRLNRLSISKLKALLGPMFQHFQETTQRVDHRPLKVLQLEYVAVRLHGNNLPCNRALNGALNGALNDNGALNNRNMSTLTSIKGEGARDEGSNAKCVARHTMATMAPAVFVLTNASKNTTTIVGKSRETCAVQLPA